MIRVSFSVEKLAALLGVDNETTSHRTVRTNGGGLLGLEDLQARGVRLHRL
jgi:hypothetical protein